MPGVIQSIMFTGYRTPTAPTHIVSGTIQAPTNGTYNLSTGGVAGNYVDNDILFAIINTANETPPSTPAGWTYLTSYGTGTVGDAASIGLHAAWARASGTMSNAAFGDPAFLNLIARVLVIRGCRTTGAPVVVLSGTADSTSEPISFPAASTTTDKNLILHTIVHSQATGATWTTNWSSPNLTGGASLFSSGTTVEHGGGFAVYAGVKDVAGSLGSVTVETTSVTPLQLYARATYAFIP